MKEVIVCYGIPASSKDTWALEQLKLYPNKYKRVTKDLLRELLDDNVHNKENEKFLLNIRDKIIEKALRDGKSVIVSDTNFPFGGIHYQRICDIAKLVGDVTVKEKFFDVDVDECKRRNAIRLRNVPNEIIDKMYNKYVRGKAEYYQFKEVYFPENKKIEYNENLPDCYIFDIDGSLSHLKNRSPFDWKRVGEDAVDWNLKMTCNSLFCCVDDEGRSDYEIIILSGRDSICRTETEKWLKDNEILYDYLYMRKENDNRKDSIIKEELYNEHIKDKYNVVGIFDDRRQVCDMWRSLGLKVFQVEDNDF